MRLQHVSKDFCLGALAGVYGLRLPFSDLKEAARKLCQAADDTRRKAQNDSWDAVPDIRSRQSDTDPNRHRLCEGPMQYYFNTEVVARFNVQPFMRLDPRIWKAWMIIFLAMQDNGARMRTDELPQIIPDDPSN